MNEPEQSARKAKKKTDMARGGTAARGKTSAAGRRPGAAGGHMPNGDPPSLMLWGDDQAKAG